MILLIIIQGEDLKNKGLQDIEHAMEHMEKAKNNYIWDYFKDIEGLRKHRLSALKDCANDMRNRVNDMFPLLYLLYRLKMQNLIFFFLHIFYLCMLID